MSTGHSISTGQVYAGTLVSGESVVNIAGDVDREICEFAFERLEEFLSQGVKRIVFDCSNVLNLPPWWFDDQVRQRTFTTEQYSRITFRRRHRQESIKADLPKADLPKAVLLKAEWI